MRFFFFVKQYEIFLGQRIWDSCTGLKTNLVDDE